jgi:hypothetical protein
MHVFSARTQWEPLPQILYCHAFILHKNTTWASSLNHPHHIEAQPHIGIVPLTSGNPRAPARSVHTNNDDLAYLSRFVAATSSDQALGWHVQYKPSEEARTTGGQLRQSRQGDHGVLYS